MNPKNCLNIGTVKNIADAMRRDFGISNRSNSIARTVILIGAGCSRSAGIPLAAEIAQDLCVRLAYDYGVIKNGSPTPEDAINSLIERGYFKAEEVINSDVENVGSIDWPLVYDTIFSRHYCTPKEIRRIFTNIFENTGGRINWTHVCIGELVRLGYISTVITTNFDQLALEGMAKAGRLPVVAEGLESLNRITGESRTPQLLQIHGSLNTYYLRNSIDDTNQVASDLGARHAIDEILRTAKQFIVIGYNGREEGLMRLLIDAARRHPDTRISWVQYSENIKDISKLAQSLLDTSRFSEVLLGQDSDEFFRILLEELEISAPQFLTDPLFTARELTDNLLFSENEKIRDIISEHQRRVYDIGIADKKMSTLMSRSLSLSPKSGDTEEEIAQNQKMQAVGQLAAGVAHDFNNILTAIMGFSDLLLANHRRTDPSFQDIMNIKQNANRGAGLVRQLLAFSRKQPLSPEPLEINDVLADLSILLDRLLGEKVELKVVHGRNIWPVMADLNQLEQVIVNLAINAGDAMPNGGKLTIRTKNVAEAESAEFENTRSMPAGDYALIEVQDTGHGMTPEVMDKMFEPFFSTKEAGGGTGLGLSTVYGIVKQTGGFIFCTSEVDSGTIFRLFLPRHIPQEAEQHKHESRELEPENAKDLTGSASILLVEDEEAVRAYGARALASRGYKVYQAGSANEALELMAETDGQIDLVVSDVVMPKMGGAALLAELRKSRPGLKVIFISGYAENSIEESLPPNEKFYFLPKPFTLKQLATTVKDVLSE